MDIPLIIKVVSVEVTSVASVQFATGEQTKDVITVSSMASVKFLHTRYDCANVLFTHPDTGC